MKPNNVGVTHNPYNNFKPHGASGKGNHKANSAWQAPVDTFTPSFEGVADPAAANAIWRDSNHAFDAVRKLLQSALGRTDPSGQGFWANRARNIRLSEADRAQAQELISEDGFFGVTQTTERIMAFAKAMVGENASPEQIEKMRDAVQKGFDEVARMFGGFDNLPQVTRDTHASIMSAFDEWAAAARGE